jgi:rod shape-determining protein MreC
MRNLIDFIARFHAFFLFFLLEVLSLFMIVRFHNYHNATFFNSANYVSGNFYAAINDVKGYLLLKNTNELLAEENAKLRMYSYKPDSFPPYYNQEVCFDSLPYIIKYIPAKVINNTTHKANNFITLNKGSRHGIKKQMGVITQNGIVGIVADVSKNFATVMSVLHKKTNISIRLKKSGFIGTLNWGGNHADIAKISGVPVNALIEKGDTVVTSGFSSIFPKDIPIGKVVKIENTATSNFYNIEVKLFTNFYTLDYVYVVTNALKDEQDLLEANHERLSE